MGEEADITAAELVRSLAAILGAGSDKVASAVVDHVMRVSNATAVWLLWADDDAQELRLADQRGLAQARLEALAAIPYSSSDPAARVATSRARQLVEDGQGTAGLVTEAGAVLAMPVWSATPGRLLAVLAVGYAQPRHFGAIELEQAEVLSAEAALALTAALEHETSRLLSSRLLGVRDASLAVAETMSILPESALIAALKRGFRLWPSPAESEPEFLKSVLDTVVRRARELVQAEFAALGAGEDPSTPFDPWVFTGMSQETAEAIGRTPRPVGTLGVVAIGGEKIRTRDVRAHPAYRGLPEHHPAITSLLAVPVRYGSATLGNLYLANKRGGPEFTEEDQRIAELLAAQVSLAMQLTYLQSSLRVHQAQLQGVFESATAAILFIDESTGQVVANSRAMQVLGRGIHPQGGRQQYLDMLRLPDGRKVALEELPSSIALEGRSVPRTELEVVRSDGSRRWILESAAPVVGIGRRVLGAVVVIEDVTAAKELQSRREDFAAMVVHDLRTPLQTIEFDASRLVDQRGVPAPDVGRLARRIARSAKVLTRMTRDLLDASQIEAGYLHLNLEPLEPEPAVRSLLEQISPALGEHPVETRFSPGLPLVHADPARLAQVLTNLLDNAAKHAPAGSPIWVEVAPAPEGVRFSVRDAGPGIPPEVLPRLFQRYYQLGVARAKGQGRGLGLFIARGIVEAHRGRIWVESEPGRGATFHFLLPQLPDSAP